MDIFGLTMVIFSAVLHAIWNLWLKKAGGGLTFLWLFNTVGVLIYLPLTITDWQINSYVWHWYYLLIMFGSAFLNLCYFVALYYAYQETDLSIVYPLCRGSMPIIALFLAMLLLKETPGKEAILGTLIVGIGVLVLVANPKSVKQKIKWRGIIYALMSGTALAFFALWDKYAIYHLKMPPLTSYIGTMGGQALMYLPLALKDKQGVMFHLKENKRYVFGVALVCPFAYLVILWAMTFTPVSYIMPVRSSSIVIGTLIGVFLLKEKNAKLRIISSVIIVIGIIFVALDNKIF